MSIINFPKPSFDQIVGQYVESRKSLASPISIRHAVNALRSAVPTCTHSDRELVDMVARAAIDRGRTVSFDLVCDAKPS